MLTNPDDVQLLMVSQSEPFDDSTPHLWIAATPRRDALKTVLRVAPVGSFAELLSERLAPNRLLELKIRARDVRDLGAIASADMGREHVAV